MHITSGLFDHMVLQRTSRNICDVTITGTAAADGLVTSRITARAGAGKGLASRVIGRARRGQFSARLRGLPSGGPYDVELSVRSVNGTAAETLSIRDILVGDVWLLGGQSNMQGYGRRNKAIKAHAMVRAFYMNDEWDVARDPIHNINEAVDQVHSGWLDPDKPRARSRLPSPRGVGPGVTFGLSMRQKTGVPQGLIACAHGGTSMTQWYPDLKKHGSKSLYGAMCRRFHKNGSRVAGVIWYQGESDANAKDAALFEKRMRRLIGAMRRDFHDAALPFVMVQLARVFGHAPTQSPAEWNLIQDIQRLLPGRVKHCATVPAIDLPLDDAIHVSGEGMQRLGRRLAQAMAVLRGEQDAGKPPIALKTIRFSKDQALGQYVVRVQFDHVVGRLAAHGEPAGFALNNPSGANFAFRVDLDKNTAVIRIPTLGVAAGLYYGYGFAPVCNITDAADRSLPVFGPQPISLKFASRQLAQDLRAHPVFDFMGVTPFADRAMVSRPFPAPRDCLDRLPYPVNQRALKFKSRLFFNTMWDLHQDIFKCAPENLLVYFKCALVCPQAMQIGLGIGYDGPVKMWINRREVLCDPKGTNPATNEKAVVKFNAPCGRHELMFAMTSNFGKAWGIKLRCSRQDLTVKQLARPKSYCMPTLTA
ncbi:MAG: sialate O-acetylesterase [Kiritimatiellae bacterium]|nr:sialate O-acetylesterase [Kiritimatiellia bacterium]